MNILVTISCGKWQYPAKIVANLITSRAVNKRMVHKFSMQCYPSQRYRYYEWEFIESLGFKIHEPINHIKQGHPVVFFATCTIYSFLLASLCIMSSHVSWLSASPILLEKICKIKDLYFHKLEYNMWSCNRPDWAMGLPQLCFPNLC